MDDIDWRAHLKPEEAVRLQEIEQLKRDASAGRKEAKKIKDRCVVRARRAAGLMPMR